MLQEIETNTQTNSETITISSSAAEAVRAILDERKLEGYSLRVFVSGGGCSGVNFGMALDNNVRENDLVINSQSVSLIVDDKSLVYLQGAKIDYVNDPARGAGFVVDSPSNASSCGCGSGSKDQGSDCSSGGCGGSCGCSD